MDGPAPAAPSARPLAASATEIGLPNFTHAQITRVVVGITLCILLAAIDQTVVVPAVPSIATDLNGFGHLSWIVSAYLLTSTALTPIYGKLSDIYGRRALLLPAIVIFVVTSMLCGFARTLPQLILFRALQGVGGAGLMSMAQAAIADVVAPRERGRYQGYMAGAWGVASIAGPIVGGWLTDALSWRWIFWMNLPIGLAAYLLSSRALRLLVVRRRPDVRIDYVGAALLVAAVTCCLLLLSWGGVQYPWLSGPIGGLAGVAAVLLGLLYVQERRAADPLLPPRLFRNGVISRGVVIAASVSAAMFGATFLLPLFFQLVRGADASGSGTLIVPFLASNVIGAYVSGQLARRLGRSKVILLSGLSVCCLGMVGIATLDAGTPDYVSVLAMLVVGLGMGVTLPTTLVTVQNAAERRDVGAATGVMLFLRSMGSALGSTAAGAVLAGWFAARWAAAGQSSPIDLGALRNGAALARLDQAARAAASAALQAGFHAGFAVCAILLAVALATAVGLRDLPLLSSAAPTPTAGH